MTIYEDTNSKPLLDLLGGIHHGHMVLPDFQRSALCSKCSNPARTAMDYPFDG
jgi:hypothetical protein